MRKSARKCNRVELTIFSVFCDKLKLPTQWLLCQIASSSCSLYTVCLICKDYTGERLTSAAKDVQPTHSLTSTLSLYIHTALELNIAGNITESVQRLDCRFESQTYQVPYSFTVLWNIKSGCFKLCCLKQKDNTYRILNRYCVGHSS